MDELRPHILFKIDKSQCLGRGSYGAVYRAEFDSLPCAAKLLHPILLQGGDSTAITVMERFKQECQFLSRVWHPNIVQCLGVCRDPDIDSGNIALLMELMDESLTRFLKRSQQPLPYHVEVNLSHDVALALAYLHSHHIIHRDLSSNNVLLIAGSRAKVTDFGMSKMFNASQSQATPSTLCPGTAVYMSPEALKNPPVYTDKLDCFSFGVMEIQIMTRQFPNPGPLVQEIEDRRSRTGRIQIPIPDSERRKAHIDLIDPTHPLLPTALSCLSYSEGDRPSALDLCQLLAALKGSSQYTRSVQQVQECGRLVPRARQIQQLAQQNQELQQQLDIMQKQYRKQNEEAQQLVAIREHQIQQSQWLEQQVAARDKQICTLQQQLEVTDERNKSQSQEFQQQVAAKDAKIQTQQQQLAARQRQNEHREQELHQQIAARDKQIHTLQQQLDERNKCQSQEFQQQVAAKDAKIQTQQQQLAARQRQNEHRVQELHQQIAARDRQIQTQQQRLASMEKQKGNEVQQIQKQVEARDAQIQNLRQQSAVRQKQNECQIKELQQEIVAKHKIIETLQQQLVAGDAHTEAMQSSNRELQNDTLAVNEIQQLKQAYEKKQDTIEAQEIQLQQLEKQLQANEQVVAEFQQANDQLVQELQRIRHRYPGEETAAAMAQLSIDPQQQKTTQSISWQKGVNAPQTMSRGATTSKGEVVYLNPSGSLAVHAYNSRRQRWSRLPDCPHTSSAMVIVKGMLTAVGGQRNGEPTNLLLSLAEEVNSNTWKELFSCMPTERYSLAAVCIGKFLVAAGGYGSSVLTTVEILDIDFQHWFTATSLLHPCYQASAAVWEDKLYLLSGFNQKMNPVRTVLTCSVPKLLQSCQLQSLPGKLETSEVSEQSPVWHQIAPTPFFNSTCATLRGRLLAIGGNDVNDKDTRAIHVYNPTSDTWQAMRTMPTARHCALVAVLPGDQLMVVGGWGEQRVLWNKEPTKLATVEFCNFS